MDRSSRTVAFTYKDYADGSAIKIMTLSAVEFIRRLRLHLLPQGFTKIRHYGLLGNNRRYQRVPLARVALETSPLRFSPKPTQRPAARCSRRLVAHIVKGLTCAASAALNALAK